MPDALCLSGKTSSDPFITKRVIEAKYAESRERMLGSLTNSFTVCCFSEKEFPNDVELEVIARPLPHAPGITPLRLTHYRAQQSLPYAA